MQTRDTDIRELLDADTFDTEALEANLRDIRFINGVLGWRAYTTRAIRSIVQRAGLRSFTLLDVASGSADMPLAIAQWAASAGIDARIVATDISPQIVAIARKQSAGVPSITIEEADALALPYNPSAFDIALCTLAIHHFDPDQAVKLLANMARVANRVLVFDVQRAQLAYWGSWALTRILPMNYMTRHDAPASVRRAYTAPELHEMALQAGLRNPSVWVGFPFRLALDAPGITPGPASELADEART